MGAWIASRDSKSTAPSCPENLLTDTENSTKIPSSSKSISLDETNSADETVISDRTVSLDKTNSADETIISDGTVSRARKDLPDRVMQRYVNMRDSLLHSKPPFVLLPLGDKPDTKLPFLHIYATAHPFPTNEGDT